MPADYDKSFPLIFEASGPWMPSDALQIIASTSDVWSRFHNSSCLSQDFIPVSSVGFVSYWYISSAQGQVCMWIGTVAPAPVVMWSVRVTSQSQDNSVLHHAAGLMGTHLTLQGCLIMLATVNACTSSKSPFLATSLRG